MTDTSAPIIQLKDIRVAYPGRPSVLESFSLSVHQTERIGLIGPNGAGKSTLFLVLMGLLKPISGTVELFSTPRRKESDFVDVRRRLGLLFQNSDDQLFSPTVLEDVAFGPLNLGCNPDEVRRRVQEALAQVGLTGYDDRITHRLSGGEKRRVALASMLSMKPDFFLLDEPMAGLDEATTKRVMQFLSETKTGFIMIDHDRERLESLCDRLILLDDGRVMDL